MSLNNHSSHILDWLDHKKVAIKLPVVNTLVQQCLKQVDQNSIQVDDMNSIWESIVSVGFTIDSLTPTSTRIKRDTWYDFVLNFRDLVWKVGDEASNFPIWEDVSFEHIPLALSCIERIKKITWELLFWTEWYIVYTSIGAEIFLQEKDTGFSKEIWLLNWSL